MLFSSKKSKSITLKTAGVFIMLMAVFLFTNYFSSSQALVTDKLSSCKKEPGCHAGGQTKHYDKHDDPKAITDPSHDQFGCGDETYVDTNNPDNSYGGVKYGCHIKNNIAFDHIRRTDRTCDTCHLYDKGETSGKVKQSVVESVIADVLHSATKIPLPTGKTNADRHKAVCLDCHELAGNNHLVLHQDTTAETNSDLNSCGNAYDNKNADGTSNDSVVNKEPCHIYNNIARDHIRRPVVAQVTTTDTSVNPPKVTTTDVASLRKCTTCHSYTEGRFGLNAGTVKDIIKDPNHKTQPAPPAPQNPDAHKANCYDCHPTTTPTRSKDTHIAKHTASDNDSADWLKLPTVTLPDSTTKINFQTCGDPAYVAPGTDRSLDYNGDRYGCHKVTNIAKEHIRRTKAIFTDRTTAEPDVTCGSCHNSMVVGTSAIPVEKRIQSIIDHGSGGSLVDTDITNGYKALCTDCHSLSGGHNNAQHKMHLFDPRGPKLSESYGCKTCHGEGGAGKTKWADGPNKRLKGDDPLTTDIVETPTKVCNPCHSQGGPIDGVNDAQIGAKNNWATKDDTEDASKIYTADFKFRAGKEKWCGGCHDVELPVTEYVRKPRYPGDLEGYIDYSAGNKRLPKKNSDGTFADPANLPANSKPFIRYDNDDPLTTEIDESKIPVIDPTAKPDPNGVWAPHIAGDNVTYGYWVKGHGRSSDMFENGAPCTECHNLSNTSGANHLDHDDRTYDVDERFEKPVAKPGHEYKTSYRLNDNALEMPLLFKEGTIAGSKGTSFCTRCHGNIFKNTTGFKDDADNHSSHSTHVGIGIPGTPGAYDSDRDGNGTTGDSRATCPTCHNPHGSKMWMNSGTDNIFRNDDDIYASNPVMILNELSFGWFKNVGGAFTTGNARVTDKLDAYSGQLTITSPCVNRCHRGTMTWDHKPNNLNIDSVWVSTLDNPATTTVDESKIPIQSFTKGQTIRVHADVTLKGTISYTAKAPALNNRVFNKLTLPSWSTKLVAPDPKTIAPGTHRDFFTWDIVAGGTAAIKEGDVYTNVVIKLFTGTTLKANESLEEVVNPTPIPYATELLKNPSFEKKTDEEGFTLGWLNSQESKMTAGPVVNAKAPELITDHLVGQYYGYNIAYWNETNKSSATNYVFQDIDISNAATEIDSGKLTVNASGWLQKAEAKDSVRMWVKFLDADYVEIAGSGYDSFVDAPIPPIILPFNPLAYNKYGFVDKLIPKNTRTIQVRFNLWDEGFGAGVADEFSVKINKLP